MADKIKITENGALALELLQNADRPLTGREIAEETGLNPRGISGVLNALVTHGLVSKGEKVSQSVINRKGAQEERSYVTYVVTEFGAEFVVE